MSLTWTMDDLIMSSYGPNLDNQSTGAVFSPLMYLTLESYGRVLIKNHLFLGVACVRHSKHILQVAFDLFKAETSKKQKMVGIIHGPSNCKDSS